MFIRPCTGERVAGDMGMVESRDHLSFLSIFDGLGHGEEASRVATRAREFLRHNWSEDVVATARNLHEDMRGSIGGVAGMAVIDRRNGRVRYTGIGNTACRLIGERNSRLMSTAGHLGQQIRSPQEQLASIGCGEVLLLYSDGIKDRF